MPGAGWEHLLGTGFKNFDRPAQVPQPKDHIHAFINTLQETIWNRLYEKSSSSSWYSLSLFCWVWCTAEDSLWSSEPQKIDYQRFRSAPLLWVNHVLTTCNRSAGTCCVRAPTWSGETSIHCLFLLAQSYRNSGSLITSITTQVSVNSLEEIQAVQRDDCDDTKLCVKKLMMNEFFLCKDNHKWNRRNKWNITTMVVSYLIR